MTASKGGYYEMTNDTRSDIKLMCYTDKYGAMDLFEYSSNTGIALRDLPGHDNSYTRHIPPECRKAFKGDMDELMSYTCWYLSPVLPLYDSDGKFLGIVQYTAKGLYFLDSSDADFWSVSKSCCYLELENSLFVMTGTALKTSSFLDNVYVSTLDKPLLAVPLMAKGDQLSGMSFYNGLTNSVITYCYQDISQLSANDRAEVLDAFAHSFNYFPDSPARVLLGNAKFNPYEKLGLQVELMAWKLLHSEDSEDSYKTILIDEPSACYNFTAPPFARRNLRISKRTGTSKLGIHGLTAASAVEVNMTGSNKHELVCYDGSFGSVSVTNPAAKHIENLDFKSIRSEYLSFSEVDKSQFRMGTARSISFRQCEDVDIVAKSAERVLFTSVKNVNITLDACTAYLDMQSSSGRLNLGTIALASFQTCSAVVCRIKRADRLHMPTDNGSLALDIDSVGSMMLNVARQLSLNVKDCDLLMLNQTFDSKYEDCTIRGTICNVRKFGFVTPPCNVSGALVIRGFTPDKNDAVSFNFSPGVTSGCTAAEYVHGFRRVDLAYLMSDKKLRITLDLTDVKSTDFMFRFVMEEQVNLAVTQSKCYIILRLLVLLSTFRLKTNPGTKIRFAFGRTADYQSLRRIDNLSAWVFQGLKGEPIRLCCEMAKLNPKKFLELIESHVQSITAMLRNAGVYEFWIPSQLVDKIGLC